MSEKVVFYAGSVVSHQLHIKTNMSTFTISVILLLQCLYRNVESFATPSSDFLLGIDGSSVATGHQHICVLEQKTGEPIGGRAQCWGYDDKHGRSDAPKDVSNVVLL